MDHQTVLSSRSRRGVGYWRELWSARELLFYLAWRDVLVRYKQAALGVAWAVIRPVLTTLIFTIVFGRIAKLSSGEIPYSLLVLSGITPWLYFANAVGECGNSLVSNASLITKVYFPRLVIPVSVVIANLIDLIITITLLCILLFWFDIRIGFQIILMPFVLITMLMLTVGLGVWIAALNAKFRDVSFILPFLITFGMYLSPIGFSSEVVSDRWRTIYSLNPIVGIVDSFRYSLFGDKYSFEAWTLIYTFLTALTLVFSGIAYFRSVEREIVDVI